MHAKLLDHLAPDLWDGGEVFFVIHGADGTPLAAIEDVETAMAMVAEQGLIIIAVH